MSSCLQVVESIECDAKTTEPRDGELGVLDVGVMRDDLDVGVELLSSLFGNL
jgi:hypothetical protein